MGPKKKSGGKSKKQEGAQPPSFLISKQLDAEKIHLLTKRIDELIGSNDELRTSSSKNEKDTHDIVLYFQREMEMKDDIIARLNEELVKRETQLKFEVEKIRKKADSDVHEIQATSDESIADLQGKLGEVERELSKVESFRREKDLHNEKIAKLEKEKVDLESEMVQTVDKLERKNLEEKAQIFKDLDAQKILFREVAMREAREGMGHEFHKIYKENERIHEEIKFHRSMADDLVAEKKALEESLSNTRRELDIVKENEQEYVKQGLVRTREIKALRERVEQLEKQQIVNIERFKARSKELQTSVYKELEEATLDAAGLRRLIKIKNKELRTMKTLSATILSQRNEIEQFFLESLSEVKEFAKKQKRTEKLNQSQSRSGKGTGTAFGRSGSQGPATAASGRSTGVLPTIKGVSPSVLENRPGSQFATVDLNSSINIRELSWDDKELVLRVLFAKMNGQQGMAENAISAMKKKPNTPYLSSNDNKAVFISEGAVLPEEEFDNDYNELNYGMGLEDESIDMYDGVDTHGDNYNDDVDAGIENGKETTIEEFTATS